MTPGEVVAKAVAMDHLITIAIMKKKERRVSMLMKKAINRKYLV